MKKLVSTLNLDKREWLKYRKVESAVRMQVRCAD